MEQRLEKVHEELTDLIILTAKKDNPNHAVQILPEAIRVLIDLTKCIQSIPLTCKSNGYGGYAEG